MLTKASPEEFQEVVSEFPSKERKESTKVIPANTQHHLPEISAIVQLEFSNDT